MVVTTYEASTLTDIAAYHSDAEKSLRLYFSQNNPNFTAIFVGYKPSDIQKMLTGILNETNRRSVLVLMAHIEAAFRVDYDARRKKNHPDTLSMELRRLWKRKDRRARLDEDILGTWRDHVDPQTRQLISQLRGAFKYRHWLAHGRHWNEGNAYDFQDLYILASAASSIFSLYD